MKNLPLNFLTIIIGLCIILSSCRTEQAKSTELDTVYVRLPADPDKINPILYPFAIPKHINYNLFLPLADYNSKTLQYEAVMMDELPTKEKHGDLGCKFDITIKENAQWPDGSKVTAEDVLFTLKMILHPLTAAKSYRNVLVKISNVTLDSTNNKKLTIYLEQDNLQSLELVTNFEILPKYVYDDKGILDKYTLDQVRDEDFVENEIKKDSSLVQFSDRMNSIEFSRETVVGSGPYVLDQWIPQEAVILKRVENYWGNDEDNIAFSQYPKRIIYKIIPDDITALAEMKSGLIDILPSVSAENYTNLVEDSLSSKKYNFNSNYVMRYYFLTLNNAHPILKSQPVRKALAHVTHVDQYIDILENGFGERTIGFINPAKKYYNKDITAVPFDLNKAKAYLKADGWEDTNKNGILDKILDGKKTELSILYHASGKLGSAIALLLKEDAAKVGIDIEIVKQAYAITKEKNLSTGNFGIIASALGQSLAIDDPYTRYHSDNAKSGGTNYSLYKNPKIDLLIEQASENTEEAKLTPIFNEIQEIVHEDQPAIFLYVPLERNVSSSRINGVFSVKRPGYFVNTMQLQPVMVGN